MMAVFFLGMGYLLRKQDWWKSSRQLLLSIIVIPSSLLLEPTSLSTSPTFVMWLLIPFTGFAGYILVFKCSHEIAKREGRGALLLSYIGRQTFYIMTFHFLMFKPASLLKAYVSGLDLRMVGCHPVIPLDGENWYWVVYSLTSIILSISLAEVVRHIPAPKLI